MHSHKRLYGEYTEVMLFLMFLILYQCITYMEQFDIFPELITDEEKASWYGSESILLRWYRNV